GSGMEESGPVSLPVVLTTPHGVGLAPAAIVAWTARHHPELGDDWPLPVAAETWDGYLNDAAGHHVTEQTAIDAMESAATGPVEEGSVGGGTGMSCYEFKGGNGTASRLGDYAGTSYTVGAFLHANLRSPDDAAC